MRTMQKAGAVLITFTLAITLLSCRKQQTGTYVNNKNSNITMALKDDGSFTVTEKERNRTVSGTYKIDGTVITFSLEGKTATGKIEAGVLTDPDGDTWKKL